MNLCRNLIKRKLSVPISRVLYRKLRYRSFNLTGRCRPALHISASNLPAGIYRANNRHIWSCRRRGLPCRACYHTRGALLPHHFNLTCGIKPIGGMFSVALSLGLLRVAINHHRALSCPDFPPVYFNRRPISTLNFQDLLLYLKKHFITEGFLSH